MEPQKDYQTPSVFMNKITVLVGNILTGELTVQLSLDTANCTCHSYKQSMCGY